MIKTSPFLMAAGLAAGLFVSASGPALAQGREDGSRVRGHVEAGEVMSLREIERRILPKMRGMQYLGPEYDARAQVYRLKFLKDGRVYFIDVDAATGKIIQTR